MAFAAMNCPSCRADNEAAARACFACGAPLEPALASLSEGAVFARRYEILGPLGRGGMGMVYKAFDRELGETVAIKVLRPDVARESGRIEQRFRSEIRLARRVRHRNVCTVYGDGEDRGLLYICMEHVEGENLARAAREAGGLPTEAAWSATLQTADGLRAIHEVGVVHRDLKTANLMLDQKGVVRVMDFGIAKMHGGSTGVTVTATGSLMGTPEYMSPEQLRGDDVDFRSDLYSLGVVAFELFTGTLPFLGDTPVATIVKQLHDAPCLDVPALPGPIRPVLVRALAKNPADRYASAEDMCRALESAFGASAAGRAASPSVPSRPPPEDDTRPVGPVAGPESPPIVPLAIAQAALAVLAVYLVSAGGVVAPPQARPASPPLAVSTPEPPATTTVVRAQPSATPTLRAIQRASPARPTPAPLALAVAAPPTLPTPPVAAAVAPAAAPAVDARVYSESDVEVAPRRISGSNAAYPDWGPRLARGERVSITASFVVNEAGDVTDIRVERGGGVLEAVLLEISRWKYVPGRKDGQPVKVRVSWKHTFIGG
jgi:eukaryotic-like serine/threonine-protein kinase